MNMRRYAGELLRTMVCVVLLGAIVLVVARNTDAQVWRWSQTAGSNATADPSINWAEGMAPSAVNDSARAMMSALAKWRDDTSGLLTTGGTSTAYTLTTNQGLAATPTTGQLVAFAPHATSGASATLTVDAGSTYPIQTSPGAAIGAGVLVQGTPYTLTFNGSAWVMRNVAGNPFNIPVGGSILYFGTTAPNTNFALPFGQAISRTTYATLFSLVGTAYGTGDGSTTFNLPDLRGRAVFGLDNMGGSAASRITVAGGNFDGTVNGGTGGAQNRTLTTAQLPATSVSVTATGSTAGSLSYAGTTGGQSQTHFHQNGMASTQNFTAGPAGGGNSPQVWIGAATNTDVASSDHTHAYSGTTTGSLSVSATGSGSFGSGSAHPTVPPAIMLPYIVRIF